MNRPPVPWPLAAVQRTEPCANGAVSPGGPVNGQKRVPQRERDGPWRRFGRPTGAGGRREGIARAPTAPMARVHAPDGRKSNLQGSALRKEKTR